MGQTSNSFASVEILAQLGMGAGLLVFSSTMTLLHANRRALELTGQVGPGEAGPVFFTVPGPVSALCAEVLAALHSRNGAAGLEPVQVGPTLCELGGRIWLTGVGLPDPRSADRTRIVLIVEDKPSVRREPSTEPPQAPGSHHAAA